MKLTKDLYKIFLASMVGISSVLIVAYTMGEKSQKYLLIGIILAIANLFAMVEILCKEEE